ncbi:uncharacterized protein LOC129220921 [Uloborus diversus]|uniref:uncharacterized protein LOC129220921 n=1 Tax=Uloborus diversus TaxID=327109 RepID=UPI0024093BFC|nr:uncharacterized protein LOC129220921 [Uloborus diversus]
MKSAPQSQNKVSLLLLLATAGYTLAIPFEFELEKSIPPFGIGVPPLPEAIAKETDLEKGLEIAKKLSFDKSWPWLEKEFAFDKGVDVGIGLGREFEFEKGVGLGVEKGVGLGIGIEKAWVEKTFPWWLLHEKYFGVEKKLTFEQALAFELYKKYGYYGLWIARELERRFKIAKELGLIGREVAFQEGISLGLFKGIGLEKIFEASLKAIGVEVEKKTEFDKVFGFFKPF